MAGAKKKKKPAANPARGYATTSTVSKARVEPAEGADKTAEVDKPGTNTPLSKSNAPPSQANDVTKTTSTAEKKKEELSPEEFERQLEESELQLLAEKYSQKAKRDAQRQMQRLETDRRILRGQAESINARKWLPAELMNHILDLIQAEARFAASSTNSESANGGKLLPEEDLIIRLWTLQQTLRSAGFPGEKVEAALQFVLDISTNIGSSNKDSIWGLDEALDWLARECSLEALPLYESRGKAGLKSQAGESPPNLTLGDIATLIARPYSDTPADTPLPSGATTPLLLEPEARQKAKSKKNGASISRSPGATSPKRQIVTYDSDIEPDDLIPVYIDTKTALFELQRPQQDVPRRKGRNPGQQLAPLSLKDSSDDLEVAKLLAKIDRIEKDPLFDTGLARMQWEPKRIALERDYATARKLKAEAEAKASVTEEGRSKTIEDQLSDDDDEEEEDEVSKEAARIAAEILQQNDDDEDQDLSDLFASLPTNEVDAETGKTSTVMNSSDGSKVTIRDFGKSTGISPTRVLEEACRSRDSSVRLSYMKISETSYANRHLLSISWNKAQDSLISTEIQGVEAASSPNKFVFKMSGIATPDDKQSEAFIATTALFLIFGTSGKEEKVSLRLPTQWRELWTEYAEAKKSQADALDRVAIKELRDLIRKRQDQEEEDGVLLQGAFRGRNNTRNGGDAADIVADKRQSGGPEYYQTIWHKKCSTPRYQNMLQSRMQLPMWQFRDQVVDTIEREQIVIICGETGCGKSTQVPSFLLEHQLSQGKPCKIFCTEPRRISAISLARRVSEELGEGRGDVGTPRSLVGYSIRLEANTSKETRLVYATTGIVMRMLEGSNELKEITHLVLDEVHERSIDSDFLLIVLKKLLVRRKDLKVVLMSATVDADRFSKYLGGAPVLNVPGRTFPVQVNYLEDAIEITGYTADKRPREKVVDLDDDDEESEVDKSSKPELIKELSSYSARTRNTISQMDEYQIDFDLTVQLISRVAVDPTYTDFSKAILVFCPGIAEIRTLNDLILGDRFFQTNWLVYPMHSTIASEEQEAAFLIPPPGYRKIVLATNIAETGITIPDVTCVIDLGKHREMRFDERRQLSRLIDTFISRANAKQRRGRAGRVQPGLCFHLFTKYRHDKILSDHQAPEMLRLSLQDLAIRVKICKIGGIEETLSGALDPPSAKNIRRAIDALVDARALTAGEDLTPLGQQLARLPLDVFLGKLILLGTIFKCLDMAVTVAAILSSKSPFITPFGQRTQADTIRMAFRRGDSDLLTAYNAYLSWKRVCQSSASNGGQEFNFCRKNFLSPQTLANIEDLKGQLLVSLVDSKFLQLTDDERRNLKGVRYSSGSGGRRRQQAFFDLPQRVNINSDNDNVSQSVIAWSFYPKLLVRDVPGGKGLRNVGNNQSISLHPTSVNKGHNEIRWLSYYHMMQSKSYVGLDPLNSDYTTNGIQALKCSRDDGRRRICHRPPVRRCPRRCK